MQFRFKLAVAFTVFGLLMVTVFVVQWAFLSQPYNSSAMGSYSLDEAFTASSFMYGPQSWVPYASKMPVMPGIDVSGDSGFNLMFVDLNATSNLASTFPCVRVDYSFTGLQGTAAFHVYGYVSSNGGISWTNRVEGEGASGFYVTGSPSDINSVLPDAQVMSSYNHVYVKVSNNAGASFNDLGNGTYFMKFDNAGGGLNSLHITTNPQNPSGTVTTTSALSGSFYVDFTGSRVQTDFILLVAVNGTIGSDFGLNLRSSAP